MKINIPQGEAFEIQHIVSDYNGTIALDGKLIDGVKEIIEKLPEGLQFHVITADTFGSVEEELREVRCKIFKIGLEDQAMAKAEYIRALGTPRVAALGNGRNDLLMLREAALGIGILHNEGICTETLLASRIVCRDPLDALGYFITPKRLIATLRK